MTCSFKCILKRRMITDGLAHPLNVCNLCLTISNSFNIFSKCFRTTLDGKELTRQMGCTKKNCKIFYFLKYLGP